MIILTVTLKAVLLGAGFFGTGPFVLRLLGAGQAMMPRPWWGAAFGAVLLAGAAGSYATSAHDLAGAWDGMFDPFIHEILLETPKARSDFAWAIAGGFLMLSGLWFGFGVAAVVGVVFAIASTGHGAAVSGYAMSLVAFHVGVMAFWAGGIVLILCADRGAKVSVGAWFGRWAMALVPLAIAFGLVLSYLMVGSVSALVSDSYGRTLLVKVALVVGVLLCAVYNRRSVATQSAAALHRTVRVETVIFGAVICATAWLTHQSPPAI